MTHARQAFLYRCHHRLRQADFPLGLDDYLTALSLVEQGFGLEDKDALYRLCRLMWLKSERQAAHFRRIFDKTWDETAAEIDRVRREETMKPQPITPAPKAETELPPKSSPELPPQPEPPTEAPPSQLVGKSEAEGLAFEFNEAVSQVRLDKRAFESSASRQFFFQPTALPVTLRHMKQMWHYLRRYKRTGPATELDIEGTIAAMSAAGHFRQPALRPPRLNQARLLLLLDQGGSMVPFHLFSQLLVESAKRGGRLQESAIYYFHDVPRGYFYRDAARLQSVALSQLYPTLASSMVVMIFSDAGAARQSYEVERILHTRDFLTQLQPQVQRLVWLNPLPNSRWPNSSAAEIARLIPMFELSRTGLDAAISALNGQGRYWEQRYSWMR